MSTVTYLGDWSNHDWTRGSMDFAAMRRDGIAGGTHKCTDGLNFYKDPFWPTAIARMKPAFTGGLYGGYHVLWGNRDLGAQVDWWFSVLDATTPGWRTDPGFVLMTDNEPFSYNQAPTIAQVNQVGDLIGQRTGKRMLAYCPPWHYGAALAGLRYPLVASNYGSNPTAWYPSAFPGADSPRWQFVAGKALVLQYGSRTRMGSQSTCDASAYVGPVDQLRALLGGDDDMSFTDADRKMLGYMSAVLRMTHWMWSPDAAEWQNKGGVPEEYAPVGGGSFVPTVAQMAANLAAVKAADDAQTAAIKALTDAFNQAMAGAGGNIDAAPILAAIDEVKQTESAAVAALQQQNAALAAQVADLTHRLAAAAAAESAAMQQATGS